MNKKQKILKLSKSINYVLDVFYYAFLVLGSFIVFWFFSILVYMTDYNGFAVFCLMVCLLWCLDISYKYFKLFERNGHRYRK